MVFVFAIVVMQLQLFGTLACMWDLKQQQQQQLQQKSFFAALFCVPLGEQAFGVDKGVTPRGGGVGVGWMPCNYTTKPMGWGLWGTVGASRRGESGGGASPLMPEH